MHNALGKCIAMVEREHQKIPEQLKAPRAWYKVWGMRHHFRDLDPLDPRVKHEVFVYAENEKDALKRTKKPHVWSGVRKRLVYKLNQDEARALITVIKKRELPFNISLHRARDGFVGVKTIKDEEGKKSRIRMDELIAKEVERMRLEQNQGEV